MTPEQIIDSIAWPSKFRMAAHRTRLVAYARDLKTWGVKDHFIGSFLYNIYMDAFTESDLQRNAK